MVLENVNVILENLKINVVETETSDFDKTNINSIYTTNSNAIINNSIIYCNKGFCFNKLDNYNDNFYAKINNCIFDTDLKENNVSDEVINGNNIEVFNSNTKLNDLI